MTRSRPIEFTVPHSGLGGCRHFDEWKDSAFEKPSWEEQAVQASLAERRSQRPPPRSAGAALARQLPAADASKGTLSLPARRLDLSSLTKPWRSGMGSQAMPQQRQAPEQDPERHRNRVLTKDVSLSTAVIEQSSRPVYMSWLHPDLTHVLFGSPAHQSHDARNCGRRRLGSLRQGHATGKSWERSPRLPGAHSFKHTALPIHS